MIYGKPLQRQLIFEGNSLMNRAAGGATDGGHYIPSTLYAAMISGRKLAYTSHAISGQTQTQINAALSTRITPFVRHLDVIVLWEGTNDMYVNALSAADAYAAVVTYVSTVKGYGTKVIVCTVLARDYVSDPGDLMTRIDAYNVLMRANTAGADAVCDLASDSHFDARADASNTTYYQTDKIHQAQGGQDIVVSMLTTTLNSIL